MRDENPKQLKIAFTGGPFAGKSTTLDELIALDTQNSFAFIPEASTQIISEEYNQHTPILPTTDFIGFQNLVSKRQLSLENFALSTKFDSPVAFFDRTGVDSIGYCNLTKNSITDDVFEAVGHRRYDAVFSFELLPNYKPDKIRSETPEKRQLTHKSLTDAYSKLGYNVISVPVMSPKERASYILYRTLSLFDTKPQKECATTLQFFDPVFRRIERVEYGYTSDNWYFSRDKSRSEHMYHIKGRELFGSCGRIPLTDVLQSQNSADLYHTIRKENCKSYSIEGFEHLAKKFGLSSYNSKEIIWSWAAADILGLSSDRMHVTFVPETERTRRNDLVKA